MNTKFFLLLCITLISTSVFAKGKPQAVAAAPAVTINSAQVDWINEKIIINGENFSTDTTVTLAGLTTTISNQTANQLEIPLDSAIAGIPEGNHKLLINDTSSSSTSSISLFVEADLIDKTLAGCPCEVDWSTELGPLWNPTPKTTECVEIAGGSSNPEDIAGTILSDPADPAVYPHYPIGAAFTAEPKESVCQLTKVELSNPSDPTSLTITDLVKKRINRLQQSDCRTALANNVCNTITPAP